MLFQEATPDTSGYMIAGYVITFVVMGLYVASIYLRSRNLKQDMTVLQELDTPAPAVETKDGKTLRLDATQSCNQKESKKIGQIERSPL